MSDNTPESGESRQGRRAGVKVPIPPGPYGQSWLRFEMGRRGVGVTELAKAADLSHSTVSVALSSNQATSDVLVQLKLALDAFPIDADRQAAMTAEGWVTALKEES